jgi:hypothetical protein
MVGGNAGVQYTIPSCLKAGYYLVRHEIIALHAAYSYPGAQFYPGCHQLNVTGSGTTTPSDLVAFPGAYEGADAGITYDAYQGKLKACCMVHVEVLYSGCESPVDWIKG